jgi:hypothetical protein
MMGRITRAAGSLAYFHSCLFPITYSIKYARLGSGFNQILEMDIFVYEKLEGVYTMHAMPNDSMPYLPWYMARHYLSPSHNESVVTYISRMLTLCFVPILIRPLIFISFFVFLTGSGVASLS